MEFNELSRSVVSDVARCVEHVDGAQVQTLVDAIAARRAVFLVGTGRSGAVLAAMAIRLGHLGIAAHAVGAADCPAIKPGDLVLVGSGSGKTPVPLERARETRAAGASLATITADPASPLAAIADVLVHIPAPVAPRDPSPHTLRSLFEECLLILCDCVCKMLQDKLGISAQEMQSRHSDRE